MAIQPTRLNVGRFLAAVFFVLPFIKIGGESVFRFDVPTMRLHVFGTELWMQEFILVLMATGFLVALFLLVTFIYGRVWCGWTCPQTVFTDITSFMDRMSKKSPAAKAGAHLLLISISLLSGFTMVCYIVSPYEAIPAILAGNLGPVATGSMLTISIITYLNFAFIRRSFCATICPYGKIQTALSDEKTLLIQQDPDRLDECIDCKMCVNTCPTELDIRKGMQVGCIMCARCVDACTRVMAKKSRKSLINYSFGREGVKNRIELFRPMAVVLFIIVLFTLGAFVYKTSARSGFEFSILPHPMEARITREGEVLNAYILSIKNKKPQEISLSFNMVPEEGITVPMSHSITDMLVVPAGLVDKFPLFVRAKKSIGHDITIAISLTSDGDIPESHTKSVYFNQP